MKTILLTLFAISYLAAFGQDITGTWLLSNAHGHKASWFQDGQSVYAIYNGYNFKHFVSGRFVATNQIQGIATRINLDNDCRTVMSVRYTLSNDGNTLTESWTASDNNCDLRQGQTGSSTMTRSTPTTVTALNGFSGAAFNPSTDLTGAWAVNGEMSDWMQDKSGGVYSIYNNQGFKHFFLGVRSGNTITGAVTRVNRSNGCRTIINQTLTVVNGYTLNVSSRFGSGNCDLASNWSDNATMVRVSAELHRPGASISSGTYYIKSQLQNKSMDVQWGNNANGTILHLWDTNQGDAQQFTIEASNEPGWYYIKTKWGRVLDASSPASGATLYTYDLHGGNNQKWRFIDIGDGSYNIQSKIGTFIDVKGGNAASGTQIWMSAFSSWGNNSAQRWKLERKSTILNPTITGGIGFQLVTKATVFTNENFQGTSKIIANTTGNTQSLAQLGIPSIRSIKVVWGQKAILTYANNLRMEIIGDRENGLPANITSIEIVPYTPLDGWVDMHTHPMSHLGWGGKVFHGAPDIDILVPAQDNCQQYQRAANINQALCSCNGAHGGWGLDNGCGDALRKTLLRQVEGGLSEASVRSGGPPIQIAHHEEGARGFPVFRGWPSYNNFTHQQMWIDWIKRAYEGGLRVMVALTVNNATYAAAFSGPGDRNPDDVSSSDVQIQEMIRLVNRHNGSPGCVDNWMEIARTPQDLRRIISANKLAIILGIEVDNIGNFHKNPQINANILTAESQNLVANEIDRLFRQGIRYIFPVHVVDNKFGGTAIYEDAFNFSNYHQNGTFFDVICGEGRDSITKPYKHYEWLLGLAGAKMNVDIARRPPSLPNCNSGTGHKNRLGLTPLGEFAIKEMMKRGMIIDLDHMSDRAIERTLVLGQQFNYPINSGHSGIRSGNNASERSLKVSQYKRIASLGGLAGMGTDGALPESFRDGFNQLVQIMDYKGVAVGTDANGFAKLPRPPGIIGITYDASFPMSKTGDRSWDYNNEGVAHYGLMSDFFRDVKGIDQNGAKAIGHLYKSAEYFAQMWEKCERQKVNIR